MSGRRRPVCCASGARARRPAHGHVCGRRARGIASANPGAFATFSTRCGAAYLAEALASRGYVVAAPDHPLTKRWAPHGPRAEDVVNQPGDLRAVIDGVLAWDQSRRPFPGTIDPERIGVVGLSLGGMTATLAAFHPELRDPRIAAAVSMGGADDDLRPPVLRYGASALPDGRR